MLVIRPSVAGQVAARQRASAHVVVDVHLAHLGRHLVALLGLELLAILLLRVSLSHVTDPGGLDEIGKLERGLLNAALSLQVLALLGPVARD